MSCSGDSWRGLALSTSTSVYIDGTDETTAFGIGIFDDATGDITTGCGDTTNSIQLWLK